MTLEEILKVRFLNKKLRREKSKLKDLRESLTNTTVRLTGMPRSPNKVSVTDKVTAELMDAEKAFAELESQVVEESKSLADKIESAFAKVIEQYYFECQTLIYRYCCDYNFRKIAQSIKFSVASVYRFHQVGLSYLGFNESEILYLQAC